MEWERHPTDSLEQQLAADEHLIGRLRARQLQILRELDTRQIAAADGSRSLAEWVSARIDVGIGTARSLVRTMRRLSGRPDLGQHLSTGDITFDRVEALSQIPDPEAGLMEWADIAGVRREATKWVRNAASTVSRSAGDRFLVMQPTLDRSWWKLWGGLDGHAGAIVDKTLTEAADQLPEVEGLHASFSWKKATALAESLITDNPPPANVTVVVDAKPAAESNGDSGVLLEPGVSVARQALDSILCDSVTEVTARTDTGTIMNYGRKQRTAPPRMRRALLAEANYSCAADGCNSSRRLQVHHIRPWTQGGTTDPSNLVVLCWFHHHVIIHERSFEIVMCPDRRRVRFRQNERGPP